MDRPQGLIDLDFRLRRAGLVLLWLVIFTGVILLLRHARPAIEFVLTVLSPFMVSLIVAYIFNPVVTWLQRRFNLGRIAGVLITYALILLITVGFFAILIPILYGQLRTGITNLVNNFPEIMAKATAWLKLRVSEDELAQAREFLQQNIDISLITGRAGQVTEGAVDTTRVITKLIGTAISVTIGAIAFITFVVVICFYFLLDYSRFEHVARVLLPEDTESRVFNIWRKIDSALGGYLRGQLIVAVTIGTLYTVFLFIMGMREYAILIGFLAGFGNMIPYMGPVLGGVPAGLWIIFGDAYDGTQEKLIGVGIIIVFSIAIQTLDGFFLQPRIVGKNAELHPLLVLFALLVGAQFGLGGLIIAVPLAIMARVALKELWWEPLEQQEYENKRRAAVKRFRESQLPAALPVNAAPKPEAEAEAEAIRPDDIGDTAVEAPKAEAQPEQAPNQPTPRSRKRRRRR